MTTTKTPAPISPAVAAQQAHWHARQAADYFWQSTRGRTPHARSLARRRFMADARQALAVLGHEDFVAAFRAYSSGGMTFDEAKPIIDQLAVELALVPRVAVGGAVPAGAKDALASAKANLAAAMAQLDAALKMTSAPEVETRG